jgi:hypothetical protein
MTDFQNLDDLIDSVGRRMTAGDPPARLRARVLARLDKRPSMPRAWMAATVCAVGVAAAVGMALHERAAARIAANALATAGRLNSNEPLAAGAPIGAPRVEPQAPVFSPRIVKREPRGTPIAPAPEEVAWRARAIPALEPPDSLTLGEIQPVPLQIRPLDTLPLTVPAIGEDEDRN